MRWMLWVVLAGCAGQSAADELRNLEARAHEPDDFGGDPSVTEEQSCTGPVTVSATTICYAPKHALINAPGCSFPTN